MAVGSSVPRSSEPVPLRSAPGAPVSRRAPSPAAHSAAAPAARPPALSRVRRERSVRRGRCRRPQAWTRRSGATQTAMPTWISSIESGATPMACRTPVSTVSATRTPSAGRQRPGVRGVRPRTADDHGLPRDEEQQPEARRAVDRDDDGRGGRRPDAVGEDAGDEGEQEQAEEGEVGAPAGPAGQRRPHRHGALTSAGSTACAGGTGTGGRRRRSAVRRRPRPPPSTRRQHREQQHEQDRRALASADRAGRRCCCRLAGQVDRQCGELVEVHGPVRPDDPLVELLDGQPALAEVLAELLDDPLTVLVARSHPGLEFRPSPVPPRGPSPHGAPGRARWRPGPQARRRDRRTPQRRHGDDWCPIARERPRLGWRPAHRSDGRCAIRGPPVGCSGGGRGGSRRGRRSG